MSDNLYKKLSEERKQLQAEGNVPEWWSTGGYQLFVNKYLYQAANPREQYMRIARTLAVHTKDPETWASKFFDAMWSGLLSPSTPVLANTGTARGLPVSCAGTYIDDSIYDIYANKQEVAMLTKYGFGTASYLGDVRPRGSDIFGGGKSMGILPIIEGFQKDMEYVSQGTARRGSWAGYVPIDHGDFDEVVTYLEQHPDGNNIGWNVSDGFTQKLKDGDEEALRRYALALKTKMVVGKGYYFFPDKANRKRPQWYKDHNLDIKAAQLCLPGDTLVPVSATQTGEMVNVELCELVSRVGAGEQLYTPSVNEDGEIENRLITDAAFTGLAYQYARVITQSGVEAESTMDHGYLTLGGEYVQAQHLKIGDIVFINKNGVAEQDVVVDVFFLDPSDEFDAVETDAFMIEQDDGTAFMVYPTQLVNTTRGRIPASELVETDSIVS